jgi:hypothetical protein
VPHLRVVPYYGVASCTSPYSTKITTLTPCSAKVVSEFELYHKGAQNKAAGLKA